MPNEETTERTMLDDVKLAFGDSLLYKFTVKSTSSTVEYTNVSLKDTRIKYSKENISVFIATLLDEPFADIYDMHHNDEILVGLIDQVDEPYLLGLPYKK